RPSTSSGRACVLNRWTHNTSAFRMIAALLIIGAVSTTLDADLRAVAAVAGEPSRVSAAGITRDESPVLTLENAEAFDPAATKRRVVLVGGIDGDAPS